MITVTVNQDEQGNIIGFSASGHAQYGPEGEDIICAAVSAILQTAVFGLVDYLDLDPEVSTENGWLSCQLDAKLAQDTEVKAVLETMLVGLKKTEEAYSDYLIIDEKERGTNHD